jgi:hypothetical protein
VNRTFTSANALFEKVPRKTATDTYEHLRWTKVVLPKQLLQITLNRARLPRRGFSDYYVVREEWNEYRAGEIAHIENVLAGEFQWRLR